MIDGMQNSEMTIYNTTLYIWWRRAHIEIKFMLDQSISTGIINTLFNGRTVYEDNVNLTV